MATESSVELAERPAQADSVGETAVSCYLATIEALAEAQAEICPHIAALFQSSLVRLGRRLAFDVTPSNLKDTQSALEADLATYSKRVREYYSAKSDDVGGLLELLSRTLEVFEARDARYIDRLALLVQQMESGVRTGGDPAALRGFYEYQVAHLRTFLDRLTMDHKSVLARVRSETGGFVDRLQRAEAEANLDPVTGLVSRRELERLVRDRIMRGTPFSILLFDIHALAGLNERYGDDAGDQVLRQFGSRLMAQVRPRDTVARWGGDEFAVIFDSDAAHALARARQIAGWVSGTYAVSVNGQDWKPEVQSEVYVIEHRHGESADAFVRRVTDFRVVSAPRPMEVLLSPDECMPEGWHTL